jgi:hypothetical protein
MKTLTREQIVDAVFASVKETPAAERAEVGEGDYEIGRSAWAEAVEALAE